MPIRYLFSAAKYSGVAVIVISEPPRSTRSSSGFPPPCAIFEISSRQFSTVSPLIANTVSPARSPADAAGEPGSTLAIVGCSAVYPMPKKIEKIKI